MIGINVAVRVDDRSWGEFEPLQGGTVTVGGLPTGGSPEGQPLFFNRPEEDPQRGPITGDDYGEWSERLSNLEEIIPQEDIRNSIAKVLDDARAMRIDYQRNNAAPEASTIDQISPRR